MQLISAELPQITRLRRQDRPRGLVSGTPVLTTEGLIPVEYVLAGDEVITASGDSRRVQQVRVAVVRRMDLIRFAPHAGGRTGFGAGTALLLPAHQAVVLRDWRAQVVYGCDEVLSPAAALVDGAGVTRVAATNVALFQIQLEQDDVLLAAGLKLASVPQTARALGCVLH
jgi:hypothetical protein